MLTCAAIASRSHCNPGSRSFQKLDCSTTQLILLCVQACHAATAALWESRDHPCSVEYCSPEHIANMHKVWSSVAVCQLLVFVLDHVHLQSLQAWNHTCCRRSRGANDLVPYSSCFGIRLFSVQTRFIIGNTLQ